MEFPFDVARAFKLPPGLAVLVITNDYIEQFNTLPPEDPARHRFREKTVLTQVQKKAQQRYEAIGKILDLMGYESAKAQGLGNSVTFASCLADHPSYRVYLLVEEKVVYGIIKVGVKTLFLHAGKNGGMKKYEPFCLLDFYIHNSVQRSGYGKKLFEYMLEQEGAKVEGLAYDNPTQSMNNFLKRHYGLESCCDQANSFVTLEGFFESNDDGSAKDPNCIPATTALLEAAPKVSAQRMQDPSVRYPGFQMQDPDEQFEDEVVQPKGSGFEMEQVNLDEGEDYTEELPPMDNDLDLDGPAPRVAMYGDEDDAEYADLAAEFNGVDLDDEQEEMPATLTTPSKFQSPSNIPVPRRRSSARGSARVDPAPPSQRSSVPAMGTAAERLAASKARTAALRAELEKAQASVEAEESDRLKLAQSKVVAQKQAFAKRKADAKAQSRSSSVTNLDVERQVQRVGPGGRRVPMRQTAPVQRAPVGGMGGAKRTSSFGGSRPAQPSLKLQIGSAKQATQRGGPRMANTMPSGGNPLVQAMNSGFLL